MKWVCVMLAALLGFASGPGASNGTVTFREADPKQTGVTWVHDNAKSAEHYLPETEPPGVAIFDYNNDGKMDHWEEREIPFHPKPVTARGLGSSQSHRELFSRIVVMVP